MQRGERVLRTTELLVDLGDAEPGGRGVLVEHLGLGGQGGEQVVGPAVALGDADLRREQQRVALVERERFVQHRRGLLRSLQATLEERPRLGQVMSAERVVGQRLREKPVDVRQRGVVALLGVVGFELDEQRDVPGARIQALPQDPLGLLRARQPRVEDQCLLQQQRRAVGVAVGGVQLRVDELHHHLPVADVGEEAPRCLDVADEPWRQPERVLVGDRGVARVAERVLPEQPDLVEEQGGPGLCSERPRLLLQRGDSSAGLLGVRCGDGPQVLRELLRGAGLRQDDCRGYWRR